MRRFYYEYYVPYPFFLLLAGLLVAEYSDKVVLKIGLNFMIIVMLLEMIIIGKYCFPNQSDKVGLHITALAL